MGRANDPEVVTVDCRNLPEIQALSGGDDRRAHGAQGHVAVTGNKLRDPQPVGHGDRLDDEGATGEVAEETNLGRCAQAGREQVDHLRDDQRRNDERTRVRPQQLKAGIVVSIVCVDVRVERSSVDDEPGYRATSVARISSIRSDTSLRPLRPAPAAPSRRRVDGPPK